MGFNSNYQRDEHAHWLDGIDLRADAPYDHANDHLYDTGRYISPDDSSDNSHDNRHDSLHGSTQGNHHDSSYDSHHDSSYDSRQGYYHDDSYGSRRDSHDNYRRYDGDSAQARYEYSMSDSDDDNDNNKRQHNRQQTNRDSEHLSYNPYTTDSVYVDKPKSHIVWAVLCTALCCIPFGIVSIVYASKVESLWNIGAFKEAHEAARKAKVWALWGMVIGIGYILITFISTAIYFISLPVDYGHVG